MFKVKKEENTREIKLTEDIVNFDSLVNMLETTKELTDSLKLKSEKDEEQNEMRNFIFQITDNQIYYYLREIEPEVFERFLKWREEIKEEEVEEINGED